MQIKTFDGDQNQWDQFLVENDGSFLQSFEWGEFQKSFGKKVWRFEVNSLEEETLSQIQIIKENFLQSSAFFNNFFGMFYIPYGPCFKSDILRKGRKKVVELILKQIKKIAACENSIFLKIEALSLLPQDFEGVASLKRIQPRKTSILNLEKNEDEIFNAFHQKTKYNIRLAERKGVITGHQTIDSADDSFKSFWQLLQRTARKNKFRSYSKAYYRKLLSLQSGYLKTELFFAKFQEKIIATNIVVFFGKRATYLHGASNYKYRKYMAPQCLQWKQISEAKKRGFKEYDFWGIDEAKWPGVTRFKRGFSGKEVEYPEGQNFVLKNFWYSIYKILRKIL